MDCRFLWLDTSDLTLARARSDVVRQQLSQWDWISWDEQDFLDGDAEISLMREIGIPSMFSEGKVVCCQGLPSFHQKIAKALNDIPDGILLIVMAPVVKTASLYLKASKDGKKFRVSQADDISSPKDRVRFVSDRAEKIGLRLDEDCCRVIGEMCGKSHDMISNELKKLRACSEDGTVSIDDVMALGIGEGEAVVFELGGLIVSGKGPQAHEWLRRLLLSSDRQAVVGYLCGWARIMCMISSFGGNVRATQAVAEQIYKLDKVDDRRARRVRMYPNTGRFFHAAREMEQGNRPSWWPYYVLAECHRLELAVRLIREKEDFAKEAHRFLERIMADGPESFRTLPIHVVAKEPDRRKSKKYEVIQ